MSRSKSHLASNQKLDTSFKHGFKLFSLYLVAFTAFIGWIDYSSYGVFNPLFLLILALLLTILATFLHEKGGQKTRIDDIVEEEL